MSSHDSISIGPLTSKDDGVCFILADHLSKTNCKDCRQAATAVKSADSTEAMTKKTDYHKVAEDDEMAKDLATVMKMVAGL
eukprot:gene25852-11525_t